MNMQLFKIIFSLCLCMLLTGCMPGVSNDPYENVDPWQDNSGEPVWQEEFWDVPTPTEVYPLYISDMLVMEDIALEISINASISNRECGTTIYRFYKGCIFVTQVKIMSDIEYFICPYGKMFRCYRRECLAGKTPGEFELIREFTSQAQIEEYLIYCLDGTFPSFAVMAGINRDAKYERKFEYDWENPDTGEISTIVFDMYSLINDNEKDILLFADVETNMWVRVVFPEEATDPYLSPDWRKWTEEELFENMLISSSTYSHHYHQMTEYESKKWNELISSLSTVR